MDNIVAITDVFKQRGKYHVINTKGIELVLSPYSILLYSIKKGNEYTLSEFNELLNNVDFTECKEYLYSLLSRAVYTEKELITKLKQKKFKLKSISLALAKAKNDGYVNDEAYVKSYIESNKDKKGVYRIKSELKQKGIDDKSINESIPSEEEQCEACEKLVRKAVTDKSIDEKERNRLINKLLYKGFSYGTIKKALEHYSINAEDIGDD